MTIEVFDLDSYSDGDYAFATTRRWRPNTNGDNVYHNIVPGVGRVGGKGLEIGFLHESTETVKSYRSELMAYTMPNDDTVMKIDQEYWFSASYFFSEILSTNGRENTIFQFHQGATGTSPIYLNIVNGVLFLNHRSGKLSAYNTATGAFTDSISGREFVFKHRLCTVPFNQWFDIVVQIIPQTRTYPLSNYDGTLKIWINGTLLVSITNDYVTHNFFDASNNIVYCKAKFGQYIPAWSSGSGFADGSPENAVSVIIDNVKIGDAGSSLSDFMPTTGWASSIDFTKFKTFSRTSQNITVSGDPLIKSSNPVKQTTIQYPGDSDAAIRVRYYL